MAQRSSQWSLTRFGLGVAYYLWLGAVLVPPSPETHTSWIIFAQSWGIRLLGSIVFLALTALVLRVGTVYAYRITPGPPEPPAAAPIQDLPPSEQEGMARPRQRLSRKGRLILWICGLAFSANLYGDLRSLRDAAFSPGWFTSCFSAVLGSLFSAACVGIFAAVILLPENPGQTARDRMKSFVRRTTVPATVFAFLVAADWLVNTAWFHHQLWIGEAAGSAIRWMINLACWALLLFLWMPKPSQMNVGVPELLHVVPTPDRVGKAD